MIGRNYRLGRKAVTAHRLHGIWSQLNKSCLSPQVPGRTLAISERPTVSTAVERVCAAHHCQRECSYGIAGIGLNSDLCVGQGGD